MKQYLYAAIAAVVLFVASLQAEITSLDKAYGVLQELEMFAQGDQLEASSDSVMLALDELIRYLESDTLLSANVRLDISKKINVLVKKINLQTRAPRLDAPEIHETTILNENYYPTRDLYLRNLLITGSLILNGQQIGGGGSVPSNLYVLKAGDTMTGDLTMADQHGIVFDDTNSGSITITAPAAVSPAGTNYTFELPINAGGNGQVLTTDGGNPAMLSWQPVTAIVTATIQLYGDVVGSTSATKVAFVCGVPACNIVQTYSTVLSATSANQCGTLVLRDSNCNFSANLITATVTNALLSQTALYATNSLLSVTSQYAQNAGSTNFAFTSSLAQYALTSLTSTSAQYATNSLLSVTSQYAANAGSTNFAFTSSLAQYALTALTSTSAQYATNALLSVTSQYAANAGSTNFAFTSSLAQYALTALTSTSAQYATNSLLSVTSQYAAVAGATNFAYTSSSALLSTSAQYANVAGFTNFALTASSALLSTTAQYAAVAGATNFAYTSSSALLSTSAQYANVAGFTNFALTASSALLSTTAQYAAVAGATNFAYTSSSALLSTSAQYANVAGFTNFALTASSALLSTTAQYAAVAGATNFAYTSSSALLSTSAQYANVAGFTNFALTASSALLSTTAQYAAVAGATNFAYTSSSALLSTSAQYANVAGFTNFALTASSALLSTTAQYAAVAGATNFAYTSSSALLSTSAQYANVAGFTNFALTASSALLSTTAQYAAVAGATNFAYTSSSALLSTSAQYANVAGFTNFALTASSALLSTTAQYAAVAGTTNFAYTSSSALLSTSAQYANVAGFTNFALTASSALLSTTAQYAAVAGATNFAFTSSLAQYALTALTSTSAQYATNSLLSVTSQYAANAGSTNFAFTSSLAQYALTALTSTSAQYATNSLLSVTSQYAANAGSTNFAFTSSLAQYALTALTSTSAQYATNSLLSVTSQYAQNAGSTNFAFTSSVAQYALTSLTSTSAQYATNALLSVTAQYAKNAGSTNFAYTSSSALYSTTAQYALTALTSTSAQYATNALLSVTSQYAATAGSTNFAYTSSSALYSTTAQYALTALISTSAQYATNALLSVTSQYAANAGSTNFAYTASSALYSTTAQYAQVANSANYICGVPACNLVNTYSQVLSGTSYDIPLKLVLRDSTGSFAATTVTLTGALRLQNANGNLTTLEAGAQSFAPVYTLILPTTIGGDNQVLTTDGNNPANLFWQPVSAITTSTILLYGDVTGSSTANRVTTICGVPACNLVNTYSFVLSGTSADIPLTLVLRDSTGSFAATTVTLTGALQLQNANGNLTAFQAGAQSFAPVYTLILPTSVGGDNQVLTTDGNNPANLSWQPVTAITTSTILLYGDVTGSSTANRVTTICGVPACNLVNTYSFVLSGTSADIPLTLVLRDSTGSFSATTITASSIIVDNQTLVVDPINHLVGIGTNQPALYPQGRLLERITPNIPSFSGIAPGSCSGDFINSSYIAQPSSIIGVNQVGIISINDPVNLNLVATINGGFPTQTRVTGTTLYVLNSAGFLSPRNSIARYDVSNPLDPVFVNEFNCLPFPGNIAVTSSNVYETDVLRGLFIYDSELDYLGSTTPFSAFSLAVSNDIALVGTLEGQLYAFNVSNPANIVPLGSLLFTNPVVDINIQGIYAFVSLATHNGIPGSVQIVNISNPNALTIANVLTTNLLSPIQTLIKNNILYVVDAVLNTINEYDITTITSPVFLTSYNNGTPLSSILSNSQNLYAIPTQGSLFALNPASEFLLTVTGDTLIGGILNLLPTGSGSGQIKIGGATVLHTFNGGTYVGPNAGNFSTINGIGNLESNNISEAQNSTAVGANSLANIISGFNNTAIGAQASQYLTNGNDNTAVGFATLLENNSGSQNTVVGSRALSGSDYLCTSTITVNDCTAVGFNALNVNNADQITAIGSGALQNNSTGLQNTALGYNALQGNIAGNTNTAVGHNSLNSAQNSSNNTVIGAESGTSSSLGSYNIYLGDSINFGGEGNTIRIGTQGVQAAAYMAGVTGNLQPSALPVTINSNGLLGVGNLITTSAIYFTGQLYGDVIGTQTATQVVTVCGVPACSLVNSYSKILLATSCDNASTLVERDETGSFEVTTITFTGNSLINYSSLGGCDTGQAFVFAPTNQNTIIGLGAGNNNILTGISNVALGYNALMSATAAFDNIAIGAFAGQSLVGGVDNIAIGTDALASTQQGFCNVAIGTSALMTATDVPTPKGLIPLQYNVAIGYQALMNTLAGEAAVSPFLPNKIFINTAVGSLALTTNISGNVNTAIGYSALTNNIVGSRNTAVGNSALSTVISGDGNTAIGSGANVYDPDAQNRTAIGSGAIAFVDNSIMLGSSAVQYIMPGGYNLTDLGYPPSNLLNNVQATQLNLYDSTDTIYAGITAPENYNYTYTLYMPVSQGFANQALMTDGNNPAQLSWGTIVTNSTQSCDIPSTLVLRDDTGSFAATTITLTGNSLINYSSLGACNTGSGFIFAPTNQNTLIGLGAGNSNILTGTNNTAFGYNALAAITSGYHNAAVGVGTLSALNYNSAYNTALGNFAGKHLLNGSYNVLLGYGAGAGFTNGNNNIAIGYQSLIQTATFCDNIAIGALALWNNSANQNLAIGSYALEYNTSGTGNSAIGYTALINSTTGNYNTAFGYLAGSNSLGSNNIYLGANVTGNSSDNGVIQIGNQGVQNAAYVAGIYNNLQMGEPVVITSSGQLGIGSYSNLINTATSCDNALTLVLRDSTGSFAATTITLTGNSLINYSSVGGCDTGQSFILAPTQGNTIIGLSTGTAITTGTNNIYLGANINKGNESGAIRIGNSNQTSAYVAGIYNNLQVGEPVVITSSGQLGIGSYSNLINTATSCDNILSLVLRDSTGSFAATTITLTGNSLINYSSVGGCDTGKSFILAPTQGNTIIGLNTGTAITTGTNNIYLGANINKGNESGAIRIGNSNQTAAYVAGIYNNLQVGEPVVITSSGQLGVGSSLNLINTATSCDYALTLVLRDSTGSFSATMVTLTGNTMVSYGTSPCDPTAFIFAPLQQNTLMGVNANSNSPLIGWNNTAYGYQALTNNLTGSDNVAVGNNALNSSSNFTGVQRSIAIGSQSMPNVGSSTVDNIAIGYQSLGNLVSAFDTSYGTRNIALGNQVMTNAQGNSTCIGIGYQALQNTNYSSDNIGIGTSALSQNSGSASNAHIAIGSNALESFNSTNLSGNIAIGYGAASALTTNTGSGSSDACIMIGYQAGATNPARSTASIYIGSNLNAPVAAEFDTIRLGAFPYSIAPAGVPAHNIAIGNSALSSPSLGAASNNTAIGYQALQNNTANQLTAVGSGALSANTGGIQNTAVGYYALNQVTTSTANTAVGYRALQNITTRFGGQVALGSLTLTSLSDGGQGNTGIGSSAFTLLTTGSINTGLGFNAGSGLITGTGNILIGAYTAQGLTSGANNIIIGQGAVAAASTASNNTIIGTLVGVNSTSSNNAAVGYQALQNDTAGNQVAVGYQAMQSNTAGIQNTAVGYQALNANTTGTSNVALGYQALANAKTINNFDNIAIGAFTLSGANILGDNIAIGVNALSNANYNQGQQIAIGSGALAANTGGTYNSAVGYQTLNANTTGVQNTAVGYQALQKNTTGYANTALGYYALNQNTIGDTNMAIGGLALQNASAQSYNTAIGYNTLIGANILSYNVAIGSSALSSPNNTQGQQTAVGYSALLNNTSGANNTAVGFQTLYENQTGSGNTALGLQALFKGTANSDNTAVGYYALFGNSGTLTAGQLTAVGSGALYNNSSGGQNVAVGYYALNSNTTGTANVALGTLALATNITGTANVALGYNAGAGATGNANTIIGSSAGSGVLSGNNIIVIGNGLVGGATPFTTYIAGISGATASGGVEVYCNTSSQLGTLNSSRRYKENIKDLGNFSDNIYKLRPVQFNYISDQEKWFEAGLIAEEVVDIYPQIIVYKDGEIETIRYKQLYIMMLNEQQKDHSVLHEYKKRVETLETQNNEFTQTITTMQQQINDLQDKMNKLGLFP